MKLFNFSALIAFFICIAQIHAYGIYCAEHVTLKKGQSCSLLNKITRAKDVAFMNPLINCDKAMTKSTKVCVEPDTYYSKENYNIKYYTIKKGDSCEKLAMKFNTTVDVLKRFNIGVLDCNNMSKLAKDKNEIDYSKNGE